MTNHCDDGVPWREWVNLSPQSSSNGEEHAKGGIVTEVSVDVPQGYTGCK